uniref:PXA domain-containing protein n=1 Tax=Macrostomum lignano TaxID=282301 RepID=A0A1I8HB40_9PLAT
VWLDGFDPLMTSLRCAHRRHFQASLDRYSRCCSAGEGGPRERRRDFQAWPPYRLPTVAERAELPEYLAGVTDILHTAALHSRLLALLYKPIRSGTLSLVVFLIELALVVPRRDANTDSYTEDAE